MYFALESEYCTCIKKGISVRQGTFLFQHSCRQLLYCPARWKGAIPVNYKTTALTLKTDQVSLWLVTQVEGDEIHYNKYQVDIITKLTNRIIRELLDVKFRQKLEGSNYLYLYGSHLANCFRFAYLHASYLIHWSPQCGFLSQIVSWFHV